MDRPFVFGKTERGTQELEEECGGKTIALIPAGNIPLVGFHDVLSVLISGHSLLLRPSSEDPDLIPMLLLMLEQIEPVFHERIRIADGKLSAFDAAIATGKTIPPGTLSTTLENIRTSSARTGLRWLY